MARRGASLSEKDDRLLRRLILAYSYMRAEVRFSMLFWVFVGSPGIAVTVSKWLEACRFGEAEIGRVMTGCDAVWATF